MIYRLMIIHVLWCYGIVDIIQCRIVVVGNFNEDDEVDDEADDEAGIDDDVLC